MARYRKIDIRIWADRSFRDLSPIPPCGQGLWLYLLTAKESCIIPGLIEAREVALADRLGWPLKAFREAFQEAFLRGMAKADWEAGLVWLPNAISYNRPTSPNVITSWGDTWDELPECELKSEIYQALKAFVEGLSEAFQDAFTKAIPRPSRKALPNQEQEQEQELTPQPPKRGGDILAVFDRWVEVFWNGKGPKPKLDQKRRRKISARLGEGFTVEQLCQAIDGCKLSAFHVENGHTRLETILGDTGKVESHIARLSASGPPPDTGPLAAEKAAALLAKREAVKAGDWEAQQAADEELQRLCEQRRRLQAEGAA